VLFGDSHAAQWFPAIEELATEHRWRLVSLTKASCPAADVGVWSPSLKRAYTECDTWRASVLQRIATLHPSIVFVSNSRVARLLVGADILISQTHDDVWIPALGRMLDSLKRDAASVVLIGDTPNPQGNPPVCLSAHLDDTLACTTDAATSLAVARTAAEAALARSLGVTFVDPSRWICPSDPCPVVIGRYLVYRDDGHIATAFARSLAGPLGDALGAVVQ